MNYLLLDLLVQLESKKTHILSLRNVFSHKADGSPVSKADIFIDTFINEYFHEKLTDFSMISEESGVIGNKANDYQILVDPLDGTENFISGLPIWGISVGVWHLGKNFENLLFFPELNCYAHESNLNTNHFKSRIQGFSSSITNTLLNAILPGTEVRILGASSYNIYNCITGSFEKFSNPAGAWPWDLLPGANLCLKSGISVIINGKKYNGDLLDIRSKYKFKIGI